MTPKNLKERKYGKMCKSCTATRCDVCRIYAMPTHWFCNLGKLKDKQNEFGVPNKIIPREIATKFPPGVWEKKMETQDGK